MSARASIRPALRCAQKRSIESVRSRPLSTTANWRQSGSSSTADDGPAAQSRHTHFGYETVTEAEKTERVAGVFTSVASSYDRMNDLMSFGWHRLWKDHFVSSLSPGLGPHGSDASPRPQHILDIAGGTGDIAFRMLHHAHVLNRNPDVRVTVADINPAMLAVGTQRAAQSLPASQQAALAFVEANAEDLSQTRPLAIPPTADSAQPGATQSPDTEQSGRTDGQDAAAAASAPLSGIPSGSIDLYTVAFGIRNFSNIPQALREAHRVLRPGGVFACLEFSSADALPLFLGPLFHAAYKRWSFGAIPLIGQLVAGDRDSYQYLVESIERFPPPAEFRDMIAAAGFVIPGSREGTGEGYETLTGGVAAIHKGIKPLQK